MPDFRGEVDMPTRGAQVDPLGFTARGWCAWGDRPAFAVAICLDGVVVGHGPVGTVLRSDVADATKSDNLAETGWQVPVSLSGRQSGDVAQFSVLVWGDVNSPPVVLDEFPVTVADIRTGPESSAEDPLQDFLGVLHEPR